MLLRNPAFSAVTRYLPGGSKATVKSPSSLVSASRTALVDSLSTVMRALRTTAPVVSVTVPVIVPVGPLAKTAEGRNSASNETRNQRRTIWSPRSIAFQRVMAIENPDTRHLLDRRRDSSSRTAASGNLTDQRSFGRCWKHIDAPWSECQHGWPCRESPCRQLVPLLPFPHEQCDQRNYRRGGTSYARAQRTDVSIHRKVCGRQERDRTPLYRDACAPQRQRRQGQQLPRQALLQHRPQHLFRRDAAS